MKKINIFQSEKTNNMKVKIRLIKDKKPDKKLDIEKLLNYLQNSCLFSDKLLTLTGYTFQNRFNVE